MHRRWGLSNARCSGWHDRRCTLGEHILHRGRGLATHAGQHVGVGVEGDGDAGVSQKLLNELRMDVFLEQERGTRVPEIVEVDPHALGAARMISDGGSKG